MGIPLERNLLSETRRDAEDNRTFCTLYGPTISVLIRLSRSVLGYFDFSFSVRLDKRVDVLLAAATEYKQLSFR